MHKSIRSSELARRAVLVMALGLLQACTTSTVTPQLTTTPTERFQAVAIGDITAKDALWSGLIPHMRRGLADRLRQSKAFASVLDPAPDPLPPGTLLVSGDVTEVDKGDAALRWIVGFGAGRQRAAANIALTDAAGTAVAKFESRKAYSGGAGIGGAGFVDMEDLLRELGEETADSVIRWSQGKTIDSAS